MLFRLRHKVPMLLLIELLAFIGSNIVPFDFNYMRLQSDRESIAQGSNLNSRHVS
jgi:hypothetical protein